MRKTAIGFFILLLCACAAKKGMMIMSQKDADRGVAKFPGLTLVSLNEGKTHYETHCGSCHGLKSPDSEPEAEWNTIVPRMVVKTNKRAGKEAVDSKMQDLILQYVVTMSTAQK